MNAIKITYKNEKTPYGEQFAVYCETDLAAVETRQWIKNRGFEVERVEEVEIEEVEE